jgi:tRNA dimethylallyltransferase
MSWQNPKRPVVVFIMGPTAAGKTELALALARGFSAEVVNVDAAQIYRGLDIGSAKPSLEMRRQVPHHLLDIRDPDATYSAGAFRRDALEAIADIHARGRLPLLVGGTMFYFRALEEGLPELPAADAKLRAVLAGEAERYGWAALHERLKTLDPARAARLAPQDAQRIQRALEIVMLTGRSVPIAGKTAAAPFRAIRLVLAPADRAVLHRRIEQRFDAMLAAGFEAEVRALREAGLSRELPAGKLVGYRQMLAYLAGELTYNDMRAAAMAATRQLAKRQLTWLRHRRGCVWLDPLAGGGKTIAVEVVQEMLQ